MLPSKKIPLTKKSLHFASSSLLFFCKEKKQKKQTLRKGRLALNYQFVRISRAYASWGAHATPFPCESKALTANKKSGRAAFLS